MRDYSKSTLMTQTLHPSMRGTGEDTVVSMYNAVLAMRNIIEYSTISVLYQNQALYQLCQRSINIEVPSYKDTNSLIAQQISSTLAPMRFAGPLTNKTLA